MQATDLIVGRRKDRNYMLKMVQLHALSASLMAGRASVCFAQAGGGGGATGSTSRTAGGAGGAGSMGASSAEAAPVPEWAVVVRLVAPQRALGAVVTTAAARTVLLELALI